MVKVTFQVFHWIYSCSWFPHTHHIFSFLHPNFLHLPGGWQATEAHMTSTLGKKLQMSPPRSESNFVEVKSKVSLMFSLVHSFEKAEPHFPIFPVCGRVQKVQPKQESPAKV